MRGPRSTFLGKADRGDVTHGCLPIEHVNAVIHAEAEDERYDQHAGHVHRLISQHSERQRKERRQRKRLDEVVLRPQAERIAALEAWLRERGGSCPHRR